MNNEHKFKLLFTITLLTLMSLPAVQFIFPFIKEKPLNEYRILAEKPEIISLFSENFKSNRGQLEDWINDHIGFRGSFIRLLNQMQYSILKKSEFNFVGSNDWFYFKTYYMGTYNASLPRREAHYEKAFQRWLVLRDHLAERDITLVVMDIPLKHFIYSENLPPDAPPMPEETVWDRFRVFLDKNNIERVRVGPALHEAKKIGLVWRKTDLHWNHRGAYFGAQALISKIASLEGHDTIPWQHEFKFVRDAIFDRGSEARAIPLLRNLNEYLDIPEPNGIGIPKMKLTNNNPFDRIYKNKGTELLPPTVSLNDSFFKNMEECGLGKHFTSLHTGRTIVALKDKTGIDAVLRSLPEGTKYFIMEFMENRMESVLPEDAALFSHPSQAQ